MRTYPSWGTFRGSGGTKDPSLSADGLTGRDRLEQLSELFERRRWDGPGTSVALAAAKARAAAVLEREEDPAAAVLATTPFVSEALTHLWLDDRIRSPEIHGLVEQAANIAGAPAEAFSTAVTLHALRAPVFLELPPRLAIQAHLGMLYALARLSDLSLWARDAAGRMSCIFHFGPRARSRRARELARDSLANGAGPGSGGDGQLLAVPVMRWQQPRAGLVGRIERRRREQCRVLMNEAAVMLGTVLERESLLERSAARQRALVAASERRLTRVGLDLHDKPLQDIAALGLELELFRRHLSRINGDARQRDLLVGRVDDFRARLYALDSELRTLCHSLESHSLISRPFAEVLAQAVHSFREHTEIEASFSVSGDVTVLSDSQRIALVRIVQECLANVREHSGAREVKVTVRVNESHVHAAVEDNGRGFEVEPTVVQAASRGRLGLVGVNERVRLLGGLCYIDSAPGGPTTVFVAVPRWDGQTLEDTPEETFAAGEYRPLEPAG